MVTVRLVPGYHTLSDEVVDSARDAVDFLGKQLREMDTECVAMICLDTKLCPINVSYVSNGALNFAYVDQKKVLKTALLSNADRFILMHNHPSGDITPSQEDVNLTEALLRAAAAIGMEFLDHVIVSSTTEDYYSFAKQGIINKKNRHWTSVVADIIGLEWPEVTRLGLKAAEEIWDFEDKRQYSGEQMTLFGGEGETCEKKEKTARSRDAR